MQIAKGFGFGPNGGRGRRGRGRRHSSAASSCRALLDLVVLPIGLLLLATSVALILRLLITLVLVLIRTLSLILLRIGLLTTIFNILLCIFLVVEFTMFLFFEDCCCVFGVRIVVVVFESVCKGVKVCILKNLFSECNRVYSKVVCVLCFVFSFFF